MKLYYWGIVWGRAEPTRLLLVHAKVPFESVDVDETLPALREAGKCEFDQIPVLELPDGTLLAQSMSILRFVGRKYGYYPDDDPHTAWIIDSTLDSIADFYDPWLKWFWEEDETQKKEYKDKAF